MTYKRPIFSQGLFGKANNEVCNLWTESAVAVRENAEGIAWAQRQLVRGSVQNEALCELLSATLISPNRWSYTLRLFVPPGTGSVVSYGSDSRWNYSNALNLREWHNTATVVDGTDVNIPPSTFGPVGSHWDNSAPGWVTTGLEAKVHVRVVYTTSGTALAYFDRPNPFRCTDLANNQFTQEGE